MSCSNGYNTLFGLLFQLTCWFLVAYPKLVSYVSGFSGSSNRVCYFYETRSFYLKSNFLENEKNSPKT